MEERITRLERSVEELRVQLATLTERVAHLPTNGSIVKIVSTALVLIAGLSTFVQWVLAAHPFAAGH